MAGENSTEAKPLSRGAEQAEEAEMSKIDFSTFVLSLSTTALHHMGLVPDPDTGHTIEANLVIAQQTIDTLEMLREKTRGNLDEDEQQLISSLLYELRLRFVDACKQAGRTG